MQSSSCLPSRSVIKYRLRRSVIASTLFPDHRKFFARYRIQDEEDGYPYTDKLQFYVMDLTAIDLADDIAKQNGLVDWAKAFAAKDWATVEKIENRGVKEAKKTMETIMSTPQQREMIRMREMAIWDYNSSIKEAEARIREAEARTKEAEDRTAIENIKSLMKNLKLSPQAAMDALSIPADRRNQYAAMLSVQKNPVSPTLQE